MIEVAATFSRFVLPVIPTVPEGRHRRVFPDLVVHLVFSDLSEHRLGPDTAIGRSLGHVAGWLVEH